LKKGAPSHLAVGCRIYSRDFPADNGVLLAEPGLWIPKPFIVRPVAPAYSFLNGIATKLELSVGSKLLSRRELKNDRPRTTVYLFKEKIDEQEIIDLCKTALFDNEFVVKRRNPLGLEICSIVLSADGKLKFSLIVQM
jgi:hypothetical protein